MRLPRLEYAEIRPESLHFSPEALLHNAGLGLFHVLATQGRRGDVVFPGRRSVFHAGHMTGTVPGAGSLCEHGYPWPFWFESCKGALHGSGAVVVLSVAAPCTFSLLLAAMVMTSEALREIITNIAMVAQVWAVNPQAAVQLVEEEVVSIRGVSRRRASRR